MAGGSVESAAAAACCSASAETADVEIGEAAALIATTCGATITPDPENEEAGTQEDPSVDPGLTNPHPPPMLSCDSNDTAGPASGAGALLYAVVAAAGAVTVWSTAL